MPRLIKNDMQFTEHFSLREFLVSRELRDLRLNEAVGDRRNPMSLHTYGKAADIYLWDENGLCWYN